MTDTLNPTAAPVGQTTPTDTGPALPFGVSAEQYADAIADAKARGLIPASTMNDATKNEAAAVEAFPEVTAPEQYDLTSYPVDTSDGDHAGAAAFDAQRRSWLQAAGLPRELGASMIAAVVNAERKNINATPEQRELTIRETRATLANLWGPSTDANIELANRFLDHVEAKAPGVLAYLDASGAANDPAVVAQVFHAAERFLATGGKL